MDGGEGGVWCKICPGPSLHGGLNRYMNQLSLVGKGELWG